MELRGEPLSLLYLNEVFDIPDADARGDGHILVVSREDDRVGVVVDRLVGIREVVIKPLSSRFSRIRTISGSAILGDEAIALIINAEALVDESIQLAAEAELESDANNGFPQRRLSA